MRSVAICICILALTACGSVSVDRGQVQRCPAIAPPLPEVLRGDPWVYDREAFPASPTPIEALQERYASALALLEHANVAIHAHRGQERVWRGSWTACGDL